MDRPVHRGNPVGILRWVAVALLGMTSGSRTFQTSTVPRPDHVVIVIEENKNLSQIIGNPDAPFLNRLASEGALFTQSFAITHPSQGNYLALFSGHTHGVDDSVPAAGSPYSEPNLASELMAAGFSFADYCEDLPFVGFTGDASGDYRRRHNPCVNYSNVPVDANRPFTDFPPPEQFDLLPTVSFVIPNLQNDMHNGSIAMGDSWLSAHLGAYADWARDHNSLLIVTFDEDNTRSQNPIPTIFFGPMVQQGRFDQHITHYTVLRTIGDAYGLTPIGHAAEVGPIEGVWVTPAVPPPEPDSSGRKGCGCLGAEFLPPFLWTVARRSKSKIRTVQVRALLQGLLVGLAIVLVQFIPWAI